MSLPLVPATELQELLEAYRSTGSVYLPSVVAAALRCASAEDLRARLQVEPDLAVEVVAGLRVAGPWVDGARWPIGLGGMDPLGMVEPVRLPGGCRTGEYAIAVPPLLNDAHPSEADAQAYVDAALVDDGWALAGGAR
jgi:hypothetical protein